MQSTDHGHISREFHIINPIIESLASYPKSVFGRLLARKKIKKSPNILPILMISFRITHHIYKYQYIILILYECLCVFSLQFIMLAVQFFMQNGSKTATVTHKYIYCDNTCRNSEMRLNCLNKKLV